MTGYWNDIQRKFSKSECKESLFEVFEHFDFFLMEITYRDSFTISADTISVESKEQQKSELVWKW